MRPPPTSRHTRLWLASVLFAGACDVTSDVGPPVVDDVLPPVAIACADVAGPPLRRLNVGELRRTLRVILDLEPDALDVLPEDGQVDGFVSVADGLEITTLFLERLDQALDSMLQARLGLPTDTDTPLDVWQIADAAPTSGLALPSPGDPSDLWWTVFGAEPVVVPFEVEHDGPSQLVLRARWTFGAQVQPEPSGPPEIGISLDGELLAERVLVDAVEPDTQDLIFNVDLTRGAHELKVVLLNPYPNSEPSLRDSVFIVSPEALLLGLERLEQRSGDARTPRWTAAQLAWLGCEPVEAPCRASVLGRVLHQAWRTPPSPEDLAAQVAWMEDLVHEGGSPVEALRTALHATLMSPRFLLRLDTLGGALAVPDALADRLAFAVWGSAADAALRQAPPTDAASIADQLPGLWADPRSSWVVEDFGARWLGLPALASRTDLDPALREAMRRETLATLDEHLRGPRPLRELTTRTDSWIGSELAAVYDLPWDPSEPEPQLMSTGRPGLLGHASLLAHTSHPGETSPVKRGAFLLDRLLCDPVSPPPPGVPGLEEASGADPRSRLEAHRADPGCASCHDELDPPGLALEVYGADGASRPGTFEPVTLSDGTRIDGPAALGAWIAAHDRTLRCTTALFATWALGRHQPADSLCVRAMAKEAEARGGRFADVVEVVLAAPPFLRGGGEP